MATPYSSDREAQTTAAAAPPAERLSPELVLVSPQLRLQALEALPDRPWEAFLPAPPPAAPRAPAAPPPAAPRPAAAPEAVVVEHRYVPEHRYGRGLALVVGALLAGVLVADFAPRAAGPALEPRTVTVGAKTRPSRPPTSTQSRPTPRPTAPARAARAVAGGGYVFAKAGRFRVAPNLRSIEGFQTRVACARTLELPAVRLRSSRFAYRGRPTRGGGAVRVFVSGRFLDATTARIVVHARSKRCDSGWLHFVAKLS